MMTVKEKNRQFFEIFLKKNGEFKIEKQFCLILKFLNLKKII